MHKPTRGVPKKNDAFVDKYVFRPISTRISGMLLHTAITPNQLTVLSICCAFVSGIFLALGSYWALVAGGVLVFFTNIFDACDGEVARAKNISSAFGAWLDGVGDRMSFFFIFLGASIGVFVQTQNPWVFVVGYVAGGSIMIAGMITSMKKYLPFMQEKHEGQGKSGVYIGLGGNVFLLMAIAAILNIVYWALWFFAVVGVLMVIKQIISHRRHAMQFRG
jgi:phosphatidylglycerophosphate synthase